MTTEKRRQAVLLMAEDNDDDFLLARSALEEARLLNDLRRVHDGVELLDYLRRRPPYEDADANPLPALILLDLNMPKIDGREALSQIRNDPALCHIPVVVLTTSSEERDVVESFRLSVAGYIIKPVDYRNFVEAVRTIDVYWTLSELPEEIVEDVDNACGASSVRAD